MLGSPDVLERSRLCELLGRALEKGGQSLLQDLDEGLQVLRHADQEVFVDQVVLGLFQGPPVAGVPALKRKRKKYESVPAWPGGKNSPF